jgi:CBS domain-containing membrane protein
MTATRVESPPRPTLNARTAADLMTRHVVSIADDAPIGEAIATLVDRGFGGAPVVNAAGRAVGVISLSDIVVHDRNRGGYELPIVVVNEDPTLVRDVMTPAVCAVRPHTPAAEVIEEMVLLRVHRLFVTDADDVLIGVIAASDIVRHLAR